MSTKIVAAGYLGDFAEDATVDFMWSSFDSNGASITRSTDGTISVYKANNTTQTTVGVTDTEDFDALTGVHHVRIDTSADAFYAVGNHYTVVLSAATIDTQTINTVLASFSIENANGNLTSIDGELTNAANATLNLKSLVVSNSAGDAVTFTSTGSNGDAIALTGDGSGKGMNIQGGATGIGCFMRGGATSGAGLDIEAQSGDALTVFATAGNGDAVALQGQGSGSGLRSIGGATGAGLHGQGGTTSGVGLLVEAQAGNSNAATLTGNGTGTGLTLTPGATGNGLAITGGATSGDGIDITVTSGNEIDYGGTELRAAINAECDTANTDYGALTSVDSGDITAAGCNKIADHVIRRDYANMEASSDGDTIVFRSLVGVIAKQCNRIAISGSTLTIYKDDDTTALGTQTVTTTSGADPITELDTA